MLKLAPSLLSTLLAWHHPPSLTHLEVKITTGVFTLSPLGCLPTPGYTQQIPEACLQLSSSSGLFAPILVLIIVLKALLQDQMTIDLPITRVLCLSLGATLGLSLLWSIRPCSGEVRSHWPHCARLSKCINKGSIMCKAPF